MSKTKLNSPWGAVTYKSTETEEDLAGSFDYIQFTGVFEATIEKVYGTEYVNTTTGAITTNVIFRLIKDGDKLITCKELYTYTAKETDNSKGIKKGDTIPSKGYNLLAAVIGMTSGKSSATATWTKTVINEYGKDINAREMKTLAGKKINVRTQIERKIYTNKDKETKASEDTTLDRVFSIDGYSLTEYNEAMDKIKKDSTIKLSDAVEAKAIIASGKLKDKPRYKKCEPEEWLALYEMQTSSDDDSDDNGLDGHTTTASDDSLPTLDENEELPTLEDTKELPDIDGDALPNLDDTDTAKPVKSVPTLEEVPDLDLDGLDAIKI